MIPRSPALSPTWGTQRPPASTASDAADERCFFPTWRRQSQVEMNDFPRSSTFKRVWFITESSSGLGRALTEAVLARGERAVVTARAPESLRYFIEHYPAQALILELDVTRRDQVRSAVGQAIERFGRIDVLVNNEGFSAALVEEMARVRMRVMTVEPASVDAPQHGDSAAAVEAIIAGVDEAAETGAVPQRYGDRADPRWDVPPGRPRDDASESANQSGPSGG
jgi:NAD(P)-dependent dehydrogenase (short-subunit alcohol dehydrogenase family)